MCAHSSGMIGFPLRLLAREIYDRLVAIKGAQNVALITGEERIEPPNARYLLCTAEAMPRNGGDRAFVALDEAQLCADRERGHIFTDRLLNARGREETMLLGSATLEPMVRALIPGLSVEQRPRFSTLAYAGPKKLSRLPRRTAIVAFTAAEVYAIAEMLRPDGWRTTMLIYGAVAVAVIIPIAAIFFREPPEPVAAPENGAIAVGWLCVSTFIRMCTGSWLKP